MSQPTSQNLFDDNFFNCPYLFQKEDRKICQTTDKWCSS